MQSDFSSGIQSMLIEAASVRHFGKIEASTALITDVVTLPSSAWLEDQSRQEVFSNVHSQTQTIILLFCDGWPDVDVQKRSGWSKLAKSAVPVMKDIIETHLPPGGIVIRAMAARLAPGGKIDRHFDAHPSFAASHRIHVPLQTNEDVDFVIDGEVFHLNTGEGYEINNLLYHEVHNRSDQPRIHFIFDYAPADQLVTAHG